MKEKSDRLSEALKQAGASPLLVQIALQPVQDLSDGDKENTAYRHFEYLEKLLAGLQAIAAKKDTNTSINMLIKRFLLKINFNTDAFLNYYTGIIYKRLLEIETVAGKESYIIAILKKISRPRVAKEIVCNPRRDNILDTIKKWLESERRYLRGANALSGKPYLRSSGYKLKTILTVLKLAGLYRVLTDFGIFIQEKYQGAKGELMDFLSGTHSTLRQEDISPNSFRKKFDEIDEVIARSLIDLFYDLINFIKNTSSLLTNMLPR